MDSTDSMADTPSAHESRVLGPFSSEQPLPLRRSPESHPAATPEHLGTPSEESNSARPDPVGGVGIGDVGDGGNSVVGLVTGSVGLGVGLGVIGVGGVGRGFVGGDGGLPQLVEMLTSAQFQNCSGTPRPSGGRGWLHCPRFPGSKPGLNSYLSYPTSKHEFPVT